MSTQQWQLAVEVMKLAVWFSVLSVIFAPLEWMFSVRPHRFFRKGFLTDFGYFYLNSLLPALVMATPLAGMAWLSRTLMPNVILSFVAGLPLWQKSMIAFLAGEVGYYAGHRLSHGIPLLWRFHAIHHSAKEMDFLVTSRAHPVDMVFGKLSALFPVVLLGLGGPSNLEGTLVPVLMVLIGTLWGFFVHANLRWRFGVLEYILSTPAFHHWHHSRVSPLDRNFSSNLACLDWFFGSLYLPPNFPASYGIKAEMPEALVDQLAHPFLPQSQNNSMRFPPHA